MKKSYRELKPDILRYAKQTKGNFTERAKYVADKLGIPYSDNLRKRVGEWLTPKEEKEESVQFEEARKHRVNTKKRYHIFTSAQNATPLHQQFLDNIKAYAKHIGADLHVIAFRYKNPTSVFSDKSEDWWDPQVVPFLDAGRHNLHKYVTVLSDVKTQPTAVNPLSGMRGFSDMRSAIIGHPKICLDSVPVLNGYPHKLLLTTGACTLPNYTDSTAGKKGEFHHSYGFVIVELADEETFHVRQVTADSTGTFQDLWYKTEDGKTRHYPNSKAVILGDLHFGEHDDTAVNTSIEILNNLNPKNVILHDVFSGYSISHHERKDPIIQAQRELDGTGSLYSETELMLQWIEVFLKWNPVVPMANHNIFLDRWVRDIDWRKYPNRSEYLKYAQWLVSGEAPRGIVAKLIGDRFGDKVKCLGYDDSFRVGSWELGQHGDLGANGSRGSVNQYKQFNTKMIVGHSHTPSRQLNVLSVGTLTKLRLGYNKGASSWMQGCVVLHDTDKAQHIHIIKGKYTTL